jgi:hypothetical protein
MTRSPDCGFHAGILPKALGERVKRNTLTRIHESVKLARIAGGPRRRSWTTANL